MSPSAGASTNCLAAGGFEMAKAGQKAKLQRTEVRASRIEVEKHTFSLELTGAAELDPIALLSGGNVDELYIPLVQALLDLGSGYVSELGIEGATHGKVTVTTTIEGQISSPWRQDVDAWILDAVKAAVRNPGRFYQVPGTPKGLSVLSVFEKTVAPPPNLDHDESLQRFMGQVSKVKDELNKLVTEVVVSSDNYDSRKAAVDELTQEFKEVISKAVEGPLNQYLTGQPQDSLEDKQRLSSWANEQLRSVGLAFRCPNTGRPSTLIADVKSAADVRGRFRLENRDENEAKTRTFSSTTYTPLEVMPDVPRKEAILDVLKRGRAKGSRERQ